MNNSYTFVDPSYENFLIHYGTKGMKKGVRNYENYDGTLTPAGKERYSVYWTKGTNLKGKKVSYGNEPKGNPNNSGGPEAKEVVRRASEEYEKSSRYQNSDGSLNAEGRKRYGDILTEKEMSDLVRKYNSANGTNYKVGEVTFKKDGKIYTREGERLDDNVGIQRSSVTPQPKKDIFGREKEPSYKERLREMRSMSNADLQRAIDRARLEKDYVRELDIHKSRGEKFIDQMKDNAVTVAGEVGRQAFREIGSALLNQKILPAIREKTGLKTDEEWKAFQEAAKEVVKEVSKTVQQTTQNTQQTTQNTQSQGSTKTKPIEQTSTADLRKRVQEEKGVSQEQASKMSRDEVIATLRNNQGSSGQASTQSSSEQNKSQSSGQDQAKKRGLGFLAGLTGKKSESSTADKPDPFEEGRRKTEEARKQQLQRPPEYWTREQLKAAIRKDEIQNKREKKDIDGMTTEELVALVRKQQK